MEPVVLPLGLGWHLWSRAAGDHWTLLSHLSVSLAKTEPGGRVHRKTLSFDMWLAGEMQKSIGEMGPVPSWWVLPRKGSKSQYFAVFHFSLTESLCHVFFYKISFYGAGDGAQLV